jgi:hypothetical protein
VPLGGACRGEESHPPRETLATAGEAANFPQFSVPTRLNFKLAVKTWQIVTISGERVFP